MKKLMLGTRGSALALAQNELTLRALMAAHPGLEIGVSVITTSGDRGLKPDRKAGLKGLFTKEIERALLALEIDVAIHSMKDMPGQTDEALVVGAVLERAPSEDLLIAKRTPVRTVGTSSVRRARLLNWLRPELEVRELRGNVPTRLQKLRESGELDAIVLARAGLGRLGIDLEAEGFSAERLDIPPAAGQGVVALQARRDDWPTLELLRAVNHEPTWICARLEREFLRLLDGDCDLPVGVRTRLNGAVLHASAVVFETGSPGGSPSHSGQRQGREGEAPAEPREAEVSGDASAPEQLAAELFRQIHEQ
jgi:hydroxymethylbilane synthase